MDAPTKPLSMEASSHGRWWNTRDRANRSASWGPQATTTVIPPVFDGARSDLLRTPA
jgi:hypothetical protein